MVVNGGGASGRVVRYSEAAGAREEACKLYLRHHVFERFHDFGAFRLLIVGEDASNEHHRGEHYAQVQLLAV